MQPDNNIKVKLTFVQGIQYLIEKELINGIMSQNKLVVIGILSRRQGLHIWSMTFNP